MLLGQQLGRRHQRDLLAAAHGPRGGQRGDHGLAATHIALQQAEHRMVAQQIRVDFSARPLLGAGQLERQHGEQPRRQIVLVVQRQTRIGRRAKFPQPQTQLMGEQFLEGETTLRRVMAR